MKRPLTTPPAGLRGTRVVPCLEPEGMIGGLPTQITPEVETALAVIIKVPSWQVTIVNEAGHP